VLWHSICMISHEEMVLLKLKEMKKLIITSMIALLLAGVSTIRANDWPEDTSACRVIILTSMQ